MRKSLCVFFIVFLAIFIIDQAIKYMIIDIAKPQDLYGYSLIAYNDIISLALVFNTGVAFSFFTWLGEWLKYIQVFIVFIMIGVLFMQKELFRSHYIPFAMMLGAGLSNVLDRFLHGGVVDYIHWHYWFDFPIFNFADVVIDCGIALFIWQVFFAKKAKKS